MNQAYQALSRILSLVESITDLTPQPARSAADARALLVLRTIEREVRSEMFLAQKSPAESVGAADSPLRPTASLN